MQSLFTILFLLLCDALFLIVLCGILLLLSFFKKAAYAVLKRNFYGYFSNPTGYVFLCLFVLLTSVAAFWPNAFFTTNLATLNQLDLWFPYIMLFFIPAITMSIWAEERRQGTDELLLTLPADDFDIVVGKYASAAMIYTVSLLFAQISTYLVLVFLTKGDMDTGLFCANYLGYWFVGLAMISIGMIASFLTKNLTVGFILGALFNVPLAFASMAEVISPSRAIGRAISDLSLAERIDDFSRGVLSLSSVGFFILVTVFGLYFCMVLIGHRHWSSGKNGNAMFLHFFARICLLATIAVGASILFNNEDFRVDVTDGGVSSVSPTTRQLLRDLGNEKPIEVRAYLSADVPKVYSKTKYTLLSMLKEFQKTAKRNNKELSIRTFDNLEAFDEEVKLAETNYGIASRSVTVKERGAYKDQEVILGAVVRSGLEKVVIPFFDSGIPVEYELIRSINTVAKPSKVRLGILTTDAMLMGGFSQTTFQQIPRAAIITELAKQYELVSVDPTNPLNPELFDVLLAVQPSSLQPEQLTNLISAIESGVPTAIFEDPKPVLFGRVVGTGEPKRPAGNPFGGGQRPPLPKCDIRDLLDVLGITMPGKAAPTTGGLNPDILWQEYNPYPVFSALRQTTSQWIFIREGMEGTLDALSDASEVTKGLRETLFLFAGAVQATEENSNLLVQSIATTGPATGLLPAEKVFQILNTGQSPQLIESIRSEPTGPESVAVAIEPNPDRVDQEANVQINAVFVADIDCLHETFLLMRNQPEQLEGFQFQIQNVPFVLNIIDVLAGELSYPEIRRHEPQFSTLKLMEEKSDAARQIAANTAKDFRDDFEKQKQDAEAERAKRLDEIRKRVEKIVESGEITVSTQRQLLQMEQELKLKEQQENQKLQVLVEKLQKQMDEKIKEANDKADIDIRNTQNRYKFFAVLLPPIPPLIVGIVVFVSRRLREREGISKTRLV